MDPNATAIPIPNAFPPPPPGMNYLAAIQPSLIFLMICTVWSGILLPLLVALFFFSTKDNRRKPIFILNVLSITLGLVMGIYNGVIEIHAILSPLQPFSSTNFLAFTVLIIFTPWLVELILLIRLTAVYPFARTSKRLWFCIFIPLALIKIGRVANLLTYTIYYINLLQADGAGNPITIGQSSWDSHPGIKIEWILQVIDNTATSILFINRLRTGLENSERTVVSGSSHVSYATKIRGLFWIAVSNFVFPVILSIVQLIMLFRDPDFLKGAYIFMVNDYVGIIGVLLATVWASSNHWTDKTQSITTQTESDSSSYPRFARNPHLGIRSGGGSGTLKNSVIELGHLNSRQEYIEVEKTTHISV